jgi:beta-N-acetylhexosaminidase
MKGGEYLIVGVPGVALDDKTRALVEEIQPGGFILFGRNIKSAVQLRRLIDDLRSCVRHEPVVTIDQEGGRVSRLKEIGAEPPSAKQLRDKGDVSLVVRHGELMGQLLRLFGFNLNLCPVLDVSFDDEADNSLKNRTWGRSAAEVLKNAEAFARGMRSVGILNNGKHFPGYSAAAVDPHHELPEIPRTRAELEACEWIPFRSMLTELDSLMIGHICNRYLDPTGTASSLSRPIIHGILREEWGYQGLIMSDDLDMGAIINQYGVAEAVTQAMLAGNDMLLLCHRLEVAREAALVLGELPASRALEAKNRIGALRAKLATPGEFSVQCHQEVDARVYALREETLGVEAAKKRSADDGKRSPVETF